MTNSLSHLVFAGGVLLLLHSAFHIHVVRTARRLGTLGGTTLKSGVASPITAQTIELHLLPKRFLVIFFGVVAVSFSEALASTSLGVAICAGLAFYLGLEVWALTSKQSNPRPLFALDTLLYLAPALCFAAVAVAWFVI
jgi:hypothetical protein